MNKTKNFQNEKLNILFLFSIRQSSTHFGYSAMPATSISKASRRPRTSITRTDLQRSLNNETQIPWNYKDYL